MHRYSIALFVLTIITACNSYPEHPDYILTAKQTGFMEERGYQNYTIAFEMTSKSDSLPPFYLMACSWEDYAVFTNKHVIGRHVCDLNYPLRCQIGQNEKLLLTTLIRSRKNGKDLAGESFRVGMVIFDTLDMPYNEFFMIHDDSLYHQLKNQPERIVWSNEITLEKEVRPLEQRVYWEVVEK